MQIKGWKDPQPLMALVLVALLSGGCATPHKYSAERHKPAQDRFGAVALSTAKKVYLCQTIDSLIPECRDLLDPKFTPWEHAYDAIEQELKASGLTPLKPDFTSVPSFDSLKQRLTDRANKSENAVYLGTELIWLSGAQWMLDAKLFAPTGVVLFEKRAICMVIGLKKVDAQEVTHMTIRQIIADPKFKEALK